MIKIAKLIILAIIIVGVIFLVMMQQRGWEGTKENPLDSTIQASKTIADTGKDAFNKGKEIIENFKNDENNNTNLVEIGQIPCLSNQDCNILDECNEDCICQDSICWKND